MSTDLRHMAHYSLLRRKKLRTSNVCALTGLSPRQVARLASAGLIPGAKRSDGVHFEFTNRQDFRAWIKQQALRPAQLYGPSPQNVGVDCRAIARCAGRIAASFRSIAAFGITTETGYRVLLQTLDVVLDRYCDLEDVLKVPPRDCRARRRPNVIREKLPPAIAA
jgi:hypothetical protein